MFLVKFDPSTFDRDLMTAVHYFTMVDLPHHTDPLLRDVDFGSDAWMVHGAVVDADNVLPSDRRDAEVERVVVLEDMLKRVSSEGPHVDDVRVIVVLDPRPDSMYERSAARVVTYVLCRGRG
jgi:hypothetical protein